MHHPVKYRVIRGDSFVEDTSYSVLARVGKRVVWVSVSKTVCSDESFRLLAKRKDDS